MALGLAVQGPVQPGTRRQTDPAELRTALVIGAVVVAIAFVVWERFARTRLIEPEGVRVVPFLSSLGTSMCAGPRSW